MSIWKVLTFFVFFMLLCRRDPTGPTADGKWVGHTLLLDGKCVRRKMVISSIFRLIVGYIFLMNLYITIAQSRNVISIFYNILALGFVEK